jgi:outer membrane protein assembly factor BamA
VIGIAAIAADLLMPAVASGQFAGLEVGLAELDSNPQNQPQSQGPSTENSPPAPIRIKNQKVRRGTFVLAPIPISSPALGSGIIPIGAYIFSLSSHDKISPPCVVGAAGLITDNDTRAFAVFGQLFFRHDTYRVTSAFFQGNLNYSLYGTGAVAGNEGSKIPLTQEGSIFFAEVLRHLKWKIYAGPRVLSGHSLVTLRSNDTFGVPVPPDTGLRTKLISLGLSIKRDTRPNRFYPEGGTLLEFSSDFFATLLGSKYSFQSYRATFNKYWSLSTKQVLAYNAFLCATGGQPPFYGNCMYGTNNELRGYEAGRYLDTYMIATQVEYRLVLPKRFGLVAFGGIGGVAHDPIEFLRSSNLLPAAGGGLRFMLSRPHHLNLRADIAAGKNEYTFSMGVSEAF